MAERRPNRQSSASSSRHPVSPLVDEGRSSVRYSNPNIFSDEFALEPLEIADDSRPHPEGDATPFVPTPPPNNLERPPRNFQPVAETPSEILRRSKVSQVQPLGRGNSFALRQDAPSTSTPHREPSMASVSDTSNVTSLPQRTLSTASTFTIPRTQSPYQGATGPSHPYGMYPQDIGLTRTPSAATHSTIRATGRTYAGPDGPTHPYGMYPQNTVPEVVVSPVAGEAPPIPVGFPGLGQDYRRRFGPEGEEADDIIGPDGHTEQLPPYSRYPDAFLPKDNASGAAGAGAGAEAGATLQSQPGMSQAALNDSQSRLSAPRSLGSDDGGPPLNIAAASAAGQPDGSGSFKERWSEKGKKRFFHGKVPLWVLVLIVVIFGVLLGGIIGGMLDHRPGRHHGEQQVSQAIQTAPVPLDAPSTVIATVTTTTLVDATPLSSIPPDLPLLPTGTFGVPLSVPTLSSNSCLTIPSQNSAWGCASADYLSMNITVEMFGPNQVSLRPYVGPPVPIYYGPQPPGLSSACSLDLMLDKSDLDRGPAYFFQQEYDKIVIVDESAFTVGSSKRWLHEDRDYESFARVEERGWALDTVINAGDKPWYCVWNGTVLEGFIYIEQNTTAANTSLTSTASSSSAPSSIPANVGGQVASSVLASASAYIATSIPTTIPQKQKRQQASPSSVVIYPKVVKVEERRNSVNSVQPYCQQMQILNTMVPAPVTDPDGKPVIVNLTESEPVSESAVQQQARRRNSWGLGRRVNKRQTTLPSNCYCEWISD